MRIRPAHIFAFYAIVSLAVYSRAFDNPFRQDDFVYLRHVEGISLGDAFKPAPAFYSYRPGATALFYLEHKMFARNSGAYIVFNYAVHAAISILMLLILMRIGLAGTASLLASGLFLMGFGHYGKQVIWACTSGPLVSMLLALAAMLMALRWVGRPSGLRGGGTFGRPGPGSAGTLGGSGAGETGMSGGLGCALYPVLALVLLALSPLFHEASIVACIVIAFIVIVSPRTGAAPGLNRAVLFLIPLALWLGFWFLVARSHSTLQGTEGSIANALGYFVQYTGFMVLPVQRSSLMEATPMRELAITISRYLQLAIGAAILAFLLYHAFKSKGAPRILSVWFLIALAPFTLLPLPEHWLELRYLYNPSIPFCGLTAMAILALWGKKRLVWRVIAGAVIVGVTVGTVVLQVALENRYHHYAQAAEFTPRPPADSRGASSGNRQSWFRARAF